MSAQNTTNWIRIGLFALPISGILLAWASLDPQPDQTKGPEAWARFVGSGYYLLTHVFGSIGSTLLAIFGVFALGARRGRWRGGNGSWADLEPGYRWGLDLRLERHWAGLPGWHGGRHASRI